mmetsp:Transcript_13260/g.26514  ORF Transcript_13260/g.26514 Transcript_13260/m.26514 type:complete len:208 (-) Transcript_13260:2359-2982(-)
MPLGSTLGSGCLCMLARGHRYSCSRYSRCRGAAPTTMLSALSTSAAHAVEPASGSPHPPCELRREGGSDCGPKEKGSQGMEEGGSDCSSSSHPSSHSHSPLSSESESSSSSSSSSRCGGGPSNACSPMLGGGGSSPSVGSDGISHLVAPLRTDCECSKWSRAAALLRTFCEKYCEVTRDCMRCCVSCFSCFTVMCSLHTSRYFSVWW